jgi:hypothetical protein
LLIKRAMTFVVPVMMLGLAAGLGAGQAPAGDALNADALKGLADDIYRGGDPQYYYEIFVDPTKPDTIWSVNTKLEKGRAVSGRAAVDLCVRRLRIAA